MTSKIRTQTNETGAGLPIRSYFQNPTDSSIQEVANEYFSDYVTFYKDRNYEAIFSSRKVALESTTSEGEKEKRRFILGCLVIASLNKRYFDLVKEYSDEFEIENSKCNRAEGDLFYAEVYICSLEAFFQELVVVKRKKDINFNALEARISYLEGIYKKSNISDPLAEAKIACYRSFLDLNYRNLSWMDCKKSLVSAVSYFKLAQRVDASLSIWCCILLAEGEFASGDQKSALSWVKETCGLSLSKDQFNRCNVLLDSLKGAI